MLAGSHVLLGVTGSIAAYQAAGLIGLLKNELASVRVVMTRAAAELNDACEALGIGPRAPLMGAPAAR